MIKSDDPDSKDRDKDRDDFERFIERLNKMRESITAQYNLYNASRTPPTPPVTPPTPPSPHSKATPTPVNNQSNPTPTMPPQATQASASPLKGAKGSIAPAAAKQPATAAVTPPQAQAQTQITVVDMRLVRLNAYRELLGCKTLGDLQLLKLIQLSYEYDTSKRQP